MEGSEREGMPGKQGGGGSASRPRTARVSVILPSQATKVWLTGSAGRKVSEKSEVQIGRSRSIVIIPFFAEGLRLMAPVSKLLRRPLRPGFRPTSARRPLLEALESRCLLAVTVTGKVISLTEGVGAAATVASFTSNDPPIQLATNYSASIDWGDGTTTAGNISANGAGGFDVTGTHTYGIGLPTPFVGSVIVQDTVDSTSGSANFTANIVNQPPSLSNVVISSPIIEGGTATLSGTITDPGSADSFTLSVNWGDTTPVQTFNLGAGTTSFSESHTYLEEGELHGDRHRRRRRREPPRDRRPSRSW